MELIKTDLLQLSSCIKVSGTISGILRVIKKLTKNDVPFTLNDDLSVYIKFLDALKFKVGCLKYKDTKVCEHIEPLNLDIALSKYDYYGTSNYFPLCVSEHYGSLNFVFISYSNDKLLYWVSHKQKYEEDFPIVYYKIFPVLLRRGLIGKEDEYCEILSKINKKIPNELLYKKSK